MTDSELFNLDLFEAQVVHQVFILQESEIDSNGSIASDKIADIRNSTYFFRNGKRGGKGRPEEIIFEIKATYSEAEAVTKQKSIMKLLCPALKTVSQDAIDIAKVITPVLVGAALAGTIVLPLNPLLFASISLVVYRIGIATLCRDYEKNEPEKKD